MCLPEGSSNKGFVCLVHLATRKTEGETCQTHATRYFKSFALRSLVSRGREGGLIIFLRTNLATLRFCSILGELLQVRCNRSLIFNPKICLII